MFPDQWSCYIRASEHAQGLCRYVRAPAHPRLECVRHHQLRLEAGGRTYISIPITVGNTREVLSVRVPTVFDTVEEALLQRFDETLTCLNFSSFDFSCP